MDQVKPVVLYVDDVPVNLMLFKETFKKVFDITLTEFPQEALKILEEKEIQVVVSDQRMPEMTGIELLEIIAEKYPDTRRYLLTAFTDAETVIDAVNVGRVHGYIKKPFQPDEVKTTIKNSVEVFHLKKKNQQILEELEKANAELLNMDGLKSEIINSISNEITPPLNRIMGTLHLLKNKIEGDELTEVVNILDQSVFNLEQFSTLARQISTLKSPGYSLEKQPVSIEEVIQYGAIETSEELKDVDITLVKRVDAIDYQLKGNSNLLVSCLVNLIHFAKEHTAKEGEISITASDINGKLECQVEDGGNNYSDTLFRILSDQFSSNDYPLNLTMGIGLAVSQIIMEAHGGRLIFDKSAGERGKMKMVLPYE